jgi:hypothetical protein
MKLKRLRLPVHNRRRLMDHLNRLWQMSADAPPFNTGADRRVYIDVGQQTIRSAPAVISRVIVERT